MNLLIMRHGEAVRPGGEFVDFDRPLTPRGREVTPRMAEILIENGLKPARIIVSSARRTQETVELLLAVLGEVDVRVVKKLYNASPMTVLEAIHMHGAGADPLLVVGHNPGLETTVSNISGNIVPFPVGALAQASVTPDRSPDWWPYGGPTRSFRDDDLTPPPGPRRCGGPGGGRSAFSGPLPSLRAQPRPFQASDTRRSRPLARARAVASRRIPGNHRRQHGVGWPVRGRTRLRMLVVGDSVALGRGVNPRDIPGPSGWLSVWPVSMNVGSRSSRPQSTRAAAAVHSGHPPPGGSHGF